MLRILEGTVNRTDSRRLIQSAVLLLEQIQRYRGARTRKMGLVRRNEGDRDVSLFLFQVKITNVMWKKSAI